MVSTTSQTDGFALAETLIAVALMAVVAAAAATLTVQSARVLARARLDTTATQLAQDRLEQLSALSWSYGSAFAPSPLTDTSTDLSAVAPSVGGPGLSRTPPGTLDADRPGHVDYLEASGTWIGNAPPAPAAARFARRWAIQDVAGFPDLLLLTVRVIDLRSEIRLRELATLRVRTAGS